MSENPKESATTPDDPKPISKADRWWNWGRWLIPLLTAVIGATAAYFYSEYNNRLRTLQYYTEAKSGVVTKPDLGPSDFRIVVDGSPLDNISTVAVALFNATDRDFDDVPLTVTFRNADGSQPKLIVATPRTTTQNFTSPTTQPASTKGLLEFTHRIGVVNRSKSAVFQMDYVFAGATAPTVEVSAIKKGTDLAFLDISKPAVVEKEKSVGKVLFEAFAAVMGCYWTLWAVVRKIKDVRTQSLLDAEDDPEHRRQLVEKRYGLTGLANPKPDPTPAEVPL